MIENETITQSTIILEEIHRSNLQLRRSYRDGFGKISLRVRMCAVRDRVFVCTRRYAHGSLDNYLQRHRVKSTRVIILYTDRFGDPFRRRRRNRRAAKALPARVIQSVLRFVPLG